MSDEDLAFWSCWLCKKQTGLPMAVYVSPQYVDSPEMKVSQHYGDRPFIGDWFAMTILDQPKLIGDTSDSRIRDLALVEQFIQMNKQLLLDYWEQIESVMDPLDLIKGLSKVNV